MNLVRKLDIEAEAARTLLANIRDVIGDDEDAAADAVEGETSLVETISAAVERIAELEAHEESLKAREKALKERRDRFAKQAELIRTAVLLAMGTAELRKLELDHATVSVRPTPATVMTPNEADIPSRFWKAQDPKLDRKALLEALKAGEYVPGAMLSNGNETLSIRGA